MIFASKLNTSNFVELCGNNFGTVDQASYLIDENRELQLLRIVSQMCSRLNYTMKNYMSNQSFSDQNFDLVEATIT